MMYRLAVTPLLLLSCSGPSTVPPTRSPSPVADRTPPPDAARAIPGQCPSPVITASRAAPVFVTLRRDGCYGGCPVYEVTIFRDGLVHYTGERFVKSCAGEGRLEPAALTELEQLFHKKKFLSFKDAYNDRRLSDASTVHTSYELSEGKTKEVAHYLGDPAAPQTLLDVENGIDRIVNVEQWIGTEDERGQIYADWLLATATD